MTDTTNAVLTQEGKQKAEEELQELKTVRRMEIAEKIEAAKEMGDISENAEYAAAKDEQAFVEARIAELESLLANAKVIETPPAKDVVEVGSEVTAEAPDGQVRVYTIVGFNEAEPASGKISNESPLGHAFVGARVGDTVTVETPSGPKAYRIKKIS